MPKINKIRVTNIKYDHNKKQMPDITLTLNGQDSILLLANGGGKSLIIQLALQAVLPNARMGKRKISQLITGDNYTGHVAVEWLLEREGEAEHYLCTGFCFTEGYGEQPLRYYNYLFDYGPEADLTIDNLPLVKGSDLFKREHPIQYQELKDWLREHQDKRVEIFEVNKNYYNRLKRYRILREEWENIRETNASEGGVDEFFARSRTTQQLVDNLLIPSVEKMMFQDEDKQKKLFQAFSEYRSMLLEIPKIEANIKDFAVISEQAEEVVAKVRKLGELTGDFKESTLDLVQLGKTFASHCQQAAEKLDKYNKELIELEKDEEKYNWQKESYEVYREKLDWEKAVREKEKINKDFQKQKQQVKECQQQKNKLEAIFHYNELQEVEKELKKYKYKLEIINNSAPELKDKLDNLLQKLKLAWNRKKEELKTTIQVQKQKVEDITTEIDDLTNKINTLEQIQNQARDKKAEIQAWLNNYQQERENLKELLAEGEVYQPQSALKKYENRKKESKKQESNLEKEIEKIKNRQEQLNEDIITKNNKKNKAENELTNYKNELKEFKFRQEEIGGRLAGEGKFDSLLNNKLLDNKDDILLYCRDKLQNIREKRAKCQAEIANLEEKWTLFADRDYYIPHRELLNIKNFLEQHNIYTVLGSEWLARQQFSEEKKQAYLNNQPLLPYSILLEQSQVAQVKRLLQRNQELSGDIPLLFIIRNEENLAPEAAEERLLSLKDDKLYIFQPDSSRVFVSEAAFKEFKENLQQKIEIKENTLQEHIESEELAAELKEKVEEFYRQYSREDIEKLQINIKQTEEIVSDLEKNIKNAQSEKEKLKDKLKNTEKELQKNQKHQQQITEIINKLNKFVEKEKEKDDREKELENTKRKLQQMTAEIRDKRKEKENLTEKRLEEKERLRQVNSDLEKHEKEFTIYQLEEVKPGTEKDSKSYAELKNEVDQVNERLDRKQGERKEIKKLVENYSDRSQKLQAEIGKTNFNQEWLSRNSRPITEGELKDAEENFNQAQIEKENLEAQLREAESEVKSAKNLWQNTAAKIEEKFDKKTYLEFSETDHQDEFQFIQEKLKDIKQQMKQKEQEIKELEKWERVNSEMLDDIKYTLKEEYNKNKEKVEALSEEQWDEYGLKPKEIFRRWKERRDKIKESLEAQKHLVDSKFRQYLRRLQNTRNAKVKQFTRKVKQIMDNDRLYDYDYVETQFLRILEGLEQYKKYYKQQLKEREKDMEHLTDLCLRRALTVYESVMEIPQNSRIDLYGRRMQIIKMEWDILEKEQARQKIYDYLSQVLEDLQQWKEEGRDDDEIDSKMEEMLKTRNLINVIAPIEECRVRVFKPRSESIVRNNQLEYTDWSEVSRWSGGEEYSIYITMFMIMISHIREQVEGRGNVGKAILADNPFGKASSSHILKTVFEVARANQIQLVCFTAHRQDNILKEFPVVYSLQLRSAYGKEVMQAEKMEAGFYNMEEETVI